jgi:GNAT superfamily N-acetyltransferase
VDRGGGSVDRRGVDMVEVKDLARLHDFHAVASAAHDVDYVDLPCDAVEEWVPIIEGHQPAGEQVTLYVGYEGDVPVAVLTVTLSTIENLDTANAEAYVHPEHRRRGLGTQLAQFASDVVRSAGRTKLLVEGFANPDGSSTAGQHLLEELGARPMLDDVRRILDLEAFPPVTPPDVPDGYRLSQWVDHAPDDLVDGVAYLLHRMILDAPMGELELEAEKWDAKRVRDSEASSVRRHRTRYATAAVHESGEVAGLTELIVNPSRPEVAWQWNTIVEPSHRGRRLGYLVKSANLQHLVSQVPQVKKISTWNAASNSFMIDVNEQMGFRVSERWTEYQLDL